MILRRQQKAPNEKIIETRDLEWIPLAPPDYLIDANYLIENFVEREIYYYGTINNIPNEIEMTKRNDVMRFIDNCFKSQLLFPTDMTNIISICTQNVKINKRSAPETLILRIPLEQIKSVSYMKDNLIHYIVILHGIMPERNSAPNTTVISTETRIKAEEICSLINQCFQIIYTEATIKQFDHQPKHEQSKMISNGLKNHSKPEYKKYNQKFISKNIKDFRDDIKNLHELDSVYSDLSSSKADCLQNFMMKLKTVLNKDEMKQFAESLSSWQQDESMFETFCSQMHQLLGSNRIGILRDMKNFISSTDWITLEQYISEISPQSKTYSPMGNWSHLINKSPLPAFHTQRSLSFASTSNGVMSIYDEENSVHDDISSQLKLSHINNRVKDSKDITEFSKAIDSFFNQVGDLERILSTDK